MQIKDINFKLIRTDELNSSIGLNFTKVFSLLEIKDTPKRRDSYLLSRLALRRALADMSIHIPLDNLFLIKNSYIQGLDNVTASISHTKDAAIAAISKRDKIQALGVDIELKTRSVKEGAHKYYINEKDKLNSYDQLESWVIKEACYKAISNLIKEEFLLKELVCTDNRAYYKDYTCEYKIFSEDEFLIAIAYVPNI